MRILHVITGLSKAAGTTTFVENVVREQRALGYAVDVCTNQAVDKFLCSPAFSAYSLVHIHGLWSPLLHRASRTARRHHIPVVWSTHGMTAPWALHHKWWKKWLPWYLYQKPDLKRAALIHCTTNLEAEWNRALGFENVFIAPLGTTLPREMSRPVVEGDSAIKTLLYVGRIYPVKALDNAIRAFAQMRPDLQAKLRLRIVGPDQAGHQAELIRLCQQLNLSYSTLSTPLHGSQIEFVGPKYGSDLSAEYDNCDGLILVSHTENFGATVVDAMAHGKPVITSTKTPWKIVADKGCGWWASNEPDSLAKIFDTFAATSTPELNQLGQRGLALVKAEYTWPAIAHNLIACYEKCLRNYSIVEAIKI